jgi:DeoR/GlpR family transcriptional regulator of sugar metabolism
MLKEQRKRIIVELIENNDQVQIAELAELFKVSEMTIRRDLEELDQQGVIQRIHGGAVNLDQTNKKIEPPIIKRTNEQLEEKQQIAKKVASLVNDGELIFLGSGTTTLAIAEELKERVQLTVLTNAITIINSLIPAEHITLIVLGGFLRRSEMSMIGHFTEAALANLKADKVIIGIRGIDVEHGLTSDNLQELITDQAIMNMSENLIVAADHTKFGHVAAIKTAPITRATKIVTDSQVPDAILNSIEDIGVEVIKAP